MKKVKNNFQIRFDFNQYQKKWSSDSCFLTLQPKTFGIWCKLFLVLYEGFPYGHCSQLKVPKLAKNTDYYGLQKYTKEELDNLDGHQLNLLLSALLPYEQQFELAIDIEKRIHIRLMLPEKDVKAALKELEEQNILSRTQNGIIYCRDLRNDYFKSLTAYQNGKKGGNPKLKAKSVKSELPPDKMESVIATNEVGVIDRTMKYLCSSCGAVAKEIESYTFKVEVPTDPVVNDEAEQRYPDFDLKPYFKGGFWAAKKRWKFLVREDYAVWCEFVNFLTTTPMWWDVLKAQMIEPTDYATMVRKWNFTRTQWEPVLEMMLGCGLSAETKLFHRLPQFIESYNNKVNKGRRQ